ncbi:MAG: hypothetical protein O2960_19525 [Verrucomicrobia bacterium]|nr:hypothetical protein [Verrucomicrobiota bacterium]
MKKKAQWKHRGIRKAPVYTTPGQAGQAPQWEVTAPQSVAPPWFMENPGLQSKDVNPDHGCRTFNIEHPTLNAQLQVGRWTLKVDLPRKWEGEAPAEPWNSAKNGFDRSLTLPDKTRIAFESVFSSEAVSFSEGSFMESRNLRVLDVNRGQEPTWIERVSPSAPSKPVSRNGSRRSFILPFFLYFCFAASSIVLHSAEVDPSALPPPAQRQVDFDRDIQPILEASCLRCHGPERPKSRFRVDNHDRILKGGDGGIDVIPGDSQNSPLIHYVARLVEDMEMPPAGKGDPLSAEQVSLLRAWIDQGVKWSASPVASTDKFEFSMTPSIQWIHVDGNSAAFREHTWMNEHWAGGFQDFNLSKQIGDDIRLTSEGRLFFNNENYRMALMLEKQDFGFARFGFEQFRHYYDDSGGYLESLGAPAFALGRDLFLDTGRIWFDAGLALPHWPRMTLGYEYQYKDGTKSMIQWGEVFDSVSDQSAGIFPSTKEIDEKTHIIKFDLSHEIAGLRFDDSFRAEFSDLGTSRVYSDFVSLPGGTPSLITKVNENQTQFQGANALRLEKQLRDWLLISGGYLYSKLDGDAGFNLAGFMPEDPAVLLFTGDESQQITLDRRSHVFNANTSMGPWEGLLFTAGVQNDWTREEGFGRAFAPGFPDPYPKFYSSNRDRSTTEEHFGVRYTRIPFTVLYGETRFRQESIDHFESQSLDDGFGDSQDFLRDTDASADIKDYRIGLSVSPWRKVSLHSSVRHRLKQNDYNHEIDADDSEIPGNGYSAFIRNRDVRTDEFETKLVVHWMPSLKTTLKYQLTATDYTTLTDPSVSTLFDPVTFLPIDLALPGGKILAGNYDAHVYSLSTTLTPWRRLYLSSTFSYANSRSASGVINSTTVVPYEGDTFSAISSANLILNERTDWNTSYSFSRADYKQRIDTGISPFGIVYDRHGIVTGLIRRFKKNITSHLQYGYFRYDEPTSGGARNYTAHAIMASMNVVLP